jgi:importin-5
LDDDAENYAVAEQALDRLSCALGGDYLAQILMNAIPNMIGNSADWKQRHAGLMAISCIAEGCHDQLEAFLPAVLQ